MAVAELQLLFSPLPVGRVTLTNRIPSTSHAAALAGRVGFVHVVGDALAPRRVHEALLEATRAARQI